ncbi:MAG: magnesium transporter [Cyclobacteriaceae bacterium]
MENILAFELTKEYLEHFTEAVEAQNDDFIIRSLDGVKYEDITTLLQEFDTEESKYVLQLLNKEVAAEVIIGLDEEVREGFLKSFSPKQIAEFVEHLETDDAADMLNELSIKIREEVLSHIQNKEKARHVLELLRYEEDCAGGLMAKEIIKANRNWTVIQTIEEIRRQAEKVEKIYSVYVVDNDGVLLGRVALKKIILSTDKTRIDDIFESDIAAVHTYQHEEEVAEIMRKYDLEAIPVVNVSGQLVGRITIDDIVDVITEQAEQERQLMAGISEDVEEDDSVWLLTRARLPWLIIGLFGGLIGARFISIFEADLASVTALAFFIPLVTATGGNVGIQSSALVVQSLVNPSAFSSGLMAKLVKVLLVALVNGLALAALVFGLVYFTNSSKLAIVVSIALFNVVLLASLMGTLVPLLLDKLGFNPALASGPFITTANDLIGLLVYFSIAHMLYNL